MDHPSRCWSAAAGSIAILLGGPPAVEAAAPVDLLPHRAAYRLSLAQAEPGVGLVEAHGGLVLEWRAACDGWLSQQRLGFVASSDEGPGLTYDVRFSSWEARDDTRMRFAVRSHGEAGLREEFRGTAQLEGPGGKGIARYDVPEGRSIALPAGTLFPTEHVRRLIASAKAGERIAIHDLFDGSGPDALARVTAVIGAPKVMPAAEGGVREHRWPVSLAYHRLDVADELPQFELSFLLGERGVLHDVMLDYGDFTLRAELERLETLEAPTCR